MVFLWYVIVFIWYLMVIDGISMVCDGVSWYLMVFDAMGPLVTWSVLGVSEMSFMLRL